MSFSFGSIAHAMASVANDIVKVAKAAESVMRKVENNKEAVDALAMLVSPKAVEIERAAFTALGLVVNAAASTSGAVSANGLNIPMDEAMYNDFKALAEFIKAELAKRNISVPAVPPTA